MTRKIHPAASVLGLSTLALTLSACKIDNRPLLARGEPAAYYGGAPAPGPLDPSYGQVAYLPAEDAYAYPERAYSMSRAFYERPPSYAFAYEDEQPWAWEAADQGMMFAEPLDEGYRYYYYEPGEEYPYFVQDPDYGYAYGEGGTLIALFTAAGALLGRDHYDDYYPQARTYWTRAHDLNRTYWRSPRYPVQETVWRERAPRLISTHERWYRGVSAQPAWREAAARHDNGRHLGWYKVKDKADKDRAGKGRDDRRDVAFNAGRPDERHVERDGRREGSAWREARVAEPPVHKGERREAAAQKVRQERPRQVERRREDQEAPKAWREARQAERHAKPAAARAHDGKPQGGGGKEKGGGQGGGKGGGHDGGKGGDHGGGKGGGKKD